MARPTDRPAPGPSPDQPPVPAATRPEDARPSLLTVLTLVVIIGALMYMIEGGRQSGFTSIPVSVYWAIVTLTTVGYGDISPRTPIGQFLASVVMILGYSIIAIPTGIVTVEWAQNRSRRPSTPRACPHCGLTEHDDDARFCKLCGTRLPGTQ